MSLLAADLVPGSVEDRAVGCLLGLAIGDALGTTLEFKKRDTYPPLTSMVGGGWLKRRPGEWTDDTAMALALADSLLQCGELDERDLLERFVGYWKEGLYSCVGVCDDIGITTATALQRFIDTGEIHAGSTDPKTAGNGSLMRLAPVAIRYWNDPVRRRDAAVRQSLTTHGAPAAVAACAAFADMLADAIENLSIPAIFRSRVTNCGVIRETLTSWRRKSRDAIASTGFVADTLEAAIWAVGTTTCFTDAVLLAVNLGGDADTVGAVTGQLAGALYGASAIGKTWAPAGAVRIASAARFLTENARCM